MGTFDQRLESKRFDFAEGRGRADDDRRTEYVRPEHVAQRSASLRTCAPLRLAARLRKHRLRPPALDQRAHPPRRRFADAGKGEERLAEPRGDIAGLVGRAFCGQRGVAGEKHGERAVTQSLEADVGVDVAERQTPLRVEDEAEFRGQTTQRDVLQPLLQGGDARSEVKQSFGIDIVERTCDDVAQALYLGIGVNESSVLKPCVQVGKRPLAQAPQMQIGAG